MIKSLKTYLVFILLVGSIAFLFGKEVFAQDQTPTPQASPGQISEIQSEIKQLEQKIGDLQNQAKTLSSQIAVMNSQIALTELKIESTNEQIALLSQDIVIATSKISKLETSLNDLTKVLLNRIVATYQIGSLQPLNVLLSSSDISDFLMRANYLRIVQAHDKELIFDTQQAKNDYTNQKNLLEDKRKKQEALKKQLEEYTLQLAQEKKNKQTLLDVTRNDEKRYQDLLAKARAEFEAIQGIVAGRGQETEIKQVSEGEKIASLIAGASCNSGGEHLHFIVSISGATQNPFGYLKSVEYENCSGSSCGSSDGDQFGPSGSWNWPLNPKIKLTQGYGNTWATQNNAIIRQIYSFHNGLDIQGSSGDVKAVQNGKLFQGSYTGYNGCRLRYVRIDHDNSDVETFYLHINYLFS